MTTINDLKKQQEQKHSQLFKDCGLFWAFSNEQFQESKTPLKEGEKYVSIGAGGYLPKFSVDAFKKGMSDIKKWYNSEVKKIKGMRRELIAYELANHEAYYTCDISDTLAALGKGYTKKEVLKVYWEEKEKEAA